MNYTLRHGGTLAAKLIARRMIAVAVTRAQR
jgi:hypothetical protein